MQRDITYSIIKELNVKSLFRFVLVNKCTNELTNNFCKKVIRSTKIIQRYWKKYKKIGRLFNKSPVLSYNFRRIVIPY